MTLTVEDRLDALELLTRADDAATARDALTYVALFTEDGVLDGAKGEWRGREALLGAVGAIWASEGAPSSHLTLNAVIESVDGGTDEAVATSTLLIVSSTSHAVVSPPTRIRQQLVKVEGRWLIKRRSVAGDDGRFGPAPSTTGSDPGST